MSQRHERVVHHNAHLIHAVVLANVRAVIVANISIEVRLDRHAVDLCQAGDKDSRVHEQMKSLLVEFDYDREVPVSHRYREKTEHNVHVQVQVEEVR